MSTPSSYIPEHGYIAVIAAPDGHTFEQAYCDYYDLLYLIQEVYGEDYKLVTIY